LAQFIFLSSAADILDLWAAQRFASCGHRVPCP
jgi:hypothetical protein